MRILLVISFLFCIGTTSLVAQNTTNEKIALSTKEIVFLGIDFSKLRLLDEFGFIDKNGKKKCAALEFKYYNDWNEVFLIEQRKFNPNELLGVKDHKLSIEKSTELNKTIKIDDCILDNLSYKISDEEIQNIVNNYIGQGSEAIGVLIVSESLSKKLDRGAHIIVYFETESGKIILSKRYEAAPVGYGFNYYWLNTIHKCLEQHQTYVRKTRKKLKIKI